MTEKNTLKKSATLAAAGLVVAGALLAGCGESKATPIPLFKEIFRNDDFTAENGHPFSVSTKWLE